MTREEVKNLFIEILRTTHTIKHEMLDTANEQTDVIADLGMPSTELVNVIAKAEELFGVEFEDTDIDDIGSTIGDLTDLVLKYLEKKQ